MSKRGKNRIHMKTGANKPSVLDVIPDAPEHIRRYMKRHEGMTVEEAIKYFKTLAKKHKRVKAKANKAKHVAKCNRKMRRAKANKLRIANEKHTQYQQANRVKRFIYDKPAYAAMREQQGKKPRAFLPGVTVPFKQPEKVTQRDYMGAVAELKLAA